MKCQCGAKAEFEVEGRPLCQRCFKQQISDTLHEMVEEGTVDMKVKDGKVNYTLTEDD